MSPWKRPASVFFFFDRSCHVEACVANSPVVRRSTVGNLHFFIHTQRKKLPNLGLNSWSCCRCRPGSVIFMADRPPILLVSFPALPWIVSSTPWNFLGDGACMEDEKYVRQSVRFLHQKGRLMSIQDGGNFQNFTSVQV